MLFGAVTEAIPPDKEKVKTVAIKLSLFQDHHNEGASGHTKL